MSVPDLATLLRATRFDKCVLISHHGKNEYSGKTYHNLNNTYPTIYAVSHSPNWQAQTTPIHAHYQTTTAASRSTTSPALANTPKKRKNETGAYLIIRRRIQTTHRHRPIPTQRSIVIVHYKCICKIFVRLVCCLPICLLLW